ncbi:MAG TPA: PEGA domain-containing protein [Polyangia bacterium]|nr:PEGA domain-containing protein [Polyangia bacterium]
MSDDVKKVMNEVLPLPEKADRSTPRDRTKAHLSRILAAAGFALSGAAHADATVPGDKKNDKPDGKGKEVQPKPPEEPPSFHVVDPVPEPYINRRGEGFLKLETKPPGLAVTVDGEPQAEKTPIKKLKLGAGPHAITITRPDGEQENFSVEVKAKSTVKVSKDLRPKKK